MKGIPPEIDALLWQLAENGNPVAREEFELRHARYGPELARRVRMVAELRQAGKIVIHRPKFSPRPAQKSPVPHWAAFGVGGLAVLAVGAVAYVIAAPAERPAPGQPAPVPKIETVPPKVPQTVVQSPTLVQPEKPVETPKEEPASQPPPYLRPRDVQMADTSLTAAISLVAAGGGLKVTLAPGFQDQKVTFDYRGSGLNTIEILRAMGEQYGFSVLDEEEGSVLVIPARESTPTRRIGN